MVVKVMCVCVCVRVLLQKLHYDLGDCACWEYMFPSNDKTQMLTPSVHDDADEEEDVAELEVVCLSDYFSSSSSSSSSSFICPKYNSNKDSRPRAGQWGNIELL